ncbi:MAG: 4-hydroxybenzoate octaprenyltransferase [Desulfovibrio sp.]|nr:4-hydroxybenzoate octaprenyltransferase [Desulfovibrio sp.]
MKTPFGTFGNLCRMVKIEHSIFALPYAWAGSCLAALGWPPLEKLVWLTLAMVAVRSFAMAFNRLVDLPYDRANPRTKGRPLVTGDITVAQTKAFCLVMAILFIVFCAALNKVCLLLAIPALLFVATYSYLKRLSVLCHFWLGASLGLAPLAGWLAVNPASLSLAPILLFFAVTFWVAAFDIYYAFQDIDFDRSYGLYSIPARLGPDTALALAGFAHSMTTIFLFLVGLAAKLSFFWYVICFFIGLVLFLEHKVMLTKDLKKVNMAFFNMNGIVSPVMLIGILLGLYF